MTSGGSGGMLSDDAALAAKHVERLRNRDNQRRLRERRREYVQELEARLRQLEHEGVRATDAVQRAARLVVEENRVLRRLLLSQGFTQADVDRHLKEQIPLDGPSAQKVDESAGTLKVTDSTDSGVPSSAAERSSDASRQIITTPQGNGSRILYKPDCLSLPETTRNSETALTPLEFTDTAQAQNYEPQSMTRTTSFARLAAVPDEMDCEEAARIISSLRGKQDPEEVWPELGCSREKRTTVKTALLMSLAI